MKIISYAGKRAVRPVQPVPTEADRCAQDPIYFMNKHLKLDSQIAGVFSFSLTDPQERYVLSNQTHNNTITLHPRRAGITTATMAYMLWKTLFNRDFVITAVLPNTRICNLASDLLRSMYLNLDSSIKVAATSLRGAEFELVNGSSITFMGPTGNAGKTSNLGYIGDMSVMTQAEQHGIFQAMGSKSSSIIISSTPHRSGDVFHHLWNQATSGSQFYPVRIYWQEIMQPSAYMAYVQAVGQKAARRELDCEFD
jgi:hypothetical protein